jgi:excisionase family DNA binding protein
MDKQYTPEEVAEQLKVNLSSVQRWCQDGRLRATKLGRIWRIAESDLQNFLDERKNK